MRLALLTLFLLTSGCALEGVGGPGPAPVGPPGPLAALERAVRSDGVTGPAAAQRVVVVRRGVPIPAQLGLILEREDEIETDVSTTVFLRFGGGTEVIVGPGTRVKISSLKVFFGQVYVKVVGLFEIETEYVTAGVEGTEYWLRVDRGDTANIVVIEGRVRLMSKLGRWPSVSIGQFQGATIVRDAPPQRRAVDPGEINAIIRWVNEVERAAGGRRTFLVPNVIGLSPAAARSALEAAQFRVGGIRERITGRSPLDTVIESSPRPATRAALGSVVALSVEGVAIQVPSVIGSRPDDARRVLGRSKLLVGSETTRVTGRGRPGTVIEQNPTPGAPVSPGTAVHLVFEGETIKVPAVQNMPFPEAQRRLRQAGLTVGRVTESKVARVRVGIVVQQSPEAGTPVAPGSTVDLVVSAAPPGPPPPPPPVPRGGAGTPR